MDTLREQPEWDEATQRVQAYLTALGLGGVEARTRETLRIIEQARARCAAQPSLHPIKAAMEETFASLARWVAESTPGLPFESGLVTLRAQDAPAVWPRVRVSSLAAPALEAAPDLDLSRMAARDMNFGAFETIAHETWQKFAWGPVLRAAAIWTAIFFLSLYAYDRFLAP
jgi:hypothetical protein